MPDAKRLLLRGLSCLQTCAQPGITTQPMSLLLSGSVLPSRPSLHVQAPANLSRAISSRAASASVQSVSRDTVREDTSTAERPLPEPASIQISPQNGQPGHSKPLSQGDASQAGVQSTMHSPQQGGAGARGRRDKPADSLLQLAGVGPVGASKLRLKGYDSIDRLALALQSTCGGDHEKMVRHLKVSFHRPAWLMLLVSLLPDALLCLMLCCISLIDACFVAEHRAQSLIQPHWCPAQASSASYCTLQHSDVSACRTKWACGRCSSAGR